MSTVLQVAAAMPPTNGVSQYALDATGVFILLFVMLGPLKLIGPYAQETAALPAPNARRLAWQVALIATFSGIAGGFLGAGLLGKWHIAIDVLELSAGLIFLLVALRMVMQQYEPAHELSSPAVPPRPAKLVFPLVLTPYGVATVILFLAISADYARTLMVIAILLVVMLLNLLAMLYAQSIMRRFALPLRVLGAVLGVLQVALALQIMTLALQKMGVV